MAEGQQLVEKVFGTSHHPGDTAQHVTGGNGALVSLTDWLRQTVDSQLNAEELGQLDREAMEKRLAREIEDRFRPEMRRLERALVLQILDSTWKDHLLAMDHLNSSVRLRGYAQVDPKVEYKREGMRQFEAMWTSVADHVTDLIFRMEQLDERFVGSTWVETEAVHEEAPSAAEAVGFVEGQGADRKLEPIRNRDERVGRNAPCPCGSGKKYKQCCMRKSQVI
jgi:preprotein translocase subunit SecA